MSELKLRPPVSCYPFAKLLRGFAVGADVVRSRLRIRAPAGSQRYMVCGWIWIFMGFACVYIADFLVQAVGGGPPSFGGRGLAVISGAPPLGGGGAASAAAVEAGSHFGRAPAPGGP